MSTETKKVRKTPQKVTMKGVNMTLALEKIPGKKGAISSYGDVWNVSIQVTVARKGTNVMLVKETESYEEALGVYKRLRKLAELPDESWLCYV